MKFKDLLPFEEYLIKSKLSVEQIASKLNENTAPKGKPDFSVFASTTAKPYTGEIYGSSFKISRNISYQNSFLPVINGHIFTFNGITNIKIKMETNRTLLVVWYLAVIIIGFGLSTFDNLFKNLSNNNNLLFGGAGFLIFIAVFLVTPLFAFKIESRKSKKFLLSLLEDVGKEAI